VSDDSKTPPDEGAPAPRTTRRGFLRTTAVATAAFAVGCGGEIALGDASTQEDGGAGDAGADDTDDGGRDAGIDAGPPQPVVPPEETPEVGAFGIGIASGDVSTSAATVWTRYDGSAPLAVAVWEMDGESYALLVTQSDCTPAEGGFVHVEIGGLTAGRRYRYAFFELAGNARTGRSPIGRFRASIAPDALEPLIVGAVSCTSNGRGKETLERAGERDDLDVFLLLGDTTYNDGASTIDEFRASWAESLGSPGWMAVRRATSVLATWDDHEVDNDFDPEDRDLTTPRQAYFENLPVRRDPVSPNRLWRAVRWGLTAEIFVLDGRGERRPSTRGAEDIYLSREQMDWLKAGLTSSPCMFKLIANSVPIGDFPFPLAQDRWEGYGAQRTEILSHIDDEAIDGVVWISGDFHFASFGFVSPSGPGSTQREILAGPGAQTGNPGAFILNRTQFPWSSTTNNYTSLELLPAQRRIRVWWHEGDGSVLEVREIDYP